jgi:hypothetical protein
MLIVSESYHPRPGAEGLGDAQGVPPGISCMPALHARLASASCGRLARFIQDWDLRRKHPAVAAWTGRPASMPKWIELLARRL